LFGDSSADIKPQLPYKVTFKELFSMSTLTLSSTSNRISANEETPQESQVLCTQLMSWNRHVGSPLEHRVAFRSSYLLENADDLRTFSTSVVCQIDIILD
jgi:hypothetical protein